MHHTGTHWATDGAEQEVDRANVDTLGARVAAAFAVDPGRYESLIKACIPNRSRVQGAKYLLGSLAVVSLAGFDTDPDMLNCQNGVLDLRTGAIAKHSPAQKFTHCATVDYDPDADPRAWVDWLTATVGAEMCDWLQMAVGYSLTGHTREEVLFYLFGPSRAGKGLFSEVLLALLNKPLATSVNFDTFTAQRTGDSQNFDLAPLRPTRLVFASESNAYERFNEAKVKALTGGDEVYCAFKHRQFFSYRPAFKIWLLSNQPVNADPDDDAVWGRVRLVHFPKSHLGEEDKTLKERMKDPANLRGILVEAMRRRGIYPERVASLAVDELVWPAPAGDVLLDDPQAPVHIGGLILSATKDLDMTGEAGEFHYAAGPEASDRSEFSNFLYRALNKWVRLHALEVGLDPAVPIGLTGIHVSYHLAEDRQPRPEGVIQFTQRRVDLENPDVPKERRVAFRAGTTLVASAAGRVECVIAKPLPLTPATFATLPAGHVAHAFQVDGEKRLAALARWIDDVDDGDALSAWTTEPATKRLDFAALHSGLG
mgnify:CR=1 FL=1